ncbi:MAG: nitrogenase [Verrucomicrobiae bacterium]|nr:nitrogenase [Verrucomicrobiae bacterium]
MNPPTTATLSIPIAWQFQPGVPDAQPALGVAGEGRIASEAPIHEPRAATRNACKVCAPLGACVVFSGIENCVPFLHGSQGCATYIRRYLISHFREPVDIASSSFSEEDTVFGGARNLRLGLANVAGQYTPQAIGVATTCLAETIGEDVPRILAEHGAANSGGPELVPVSTPAYAGTHVDGFHRTVRRVVEHFATPTPPHAGINLLPGFVSPEDLRHLKELVAAFGLPCTLLPDYSDTLDGASWPEYQRVQPGGTPTRAIRRMSGARATLELGHTLLGPGADTAGRWLHQTHQVPRMPLALPIGLRETDAFMAALGELAESGCPDDIQRERGRLVDAMVDGHKYVFGKRAALFGDPDLVIGLCSFLDEIGVRPVLCASGTRQAAFEPAIREVLDHIEADDLQILTGADHARISEVAREVRPDLIFSSSKGYPLARELEVPLIRVGFPVHDRIGGQRLLHVGYRGAQRFFDLIVNTILERRQDRSETGYSYL